MSFAFFSWWGLVHDQEGIIMVLLLTFSGLLGILFGYLYGLSFALRYLR